MIIELANKKVEISPDMIVTTEVGAEFLYELREGGDVVRWWRVASMNPTASANKWVPTGHFDEGEVPKSKLIIID